MRRDRLAGVTAFVAVAQTAGFTPAAARLGVPVSAVSRAVRDLEQWPGGLCACWRNGLPAFPATISITPPAATRRRGCGR